MTPSARLSAVIEILDAVEAALMERGQAADRIATDYFRARRYAGSKDRRFVRDMVWEVLRRRSLLLAKAERANLPATARSQVLIHLLSAGPDLVPEFGAEGAHAPAALSRAEERALEAIEDMSDKDFAAAKRYSVPDWAEDGLKARFQDAFVDAAESLMHRAPLNIRRNPLAEGDWPDDLADLFSPIEGLPNGFSAQTTLRVDQHSAYKDGLFEVQDRAAQFASLLVGAAPGQQVVDYCAGAGGKSLAFAAQMEGKGQIHAFDISAQRLSQLRKRMDRASAHNIQPHTLGAQGTDAHIDRIKGLADRVVLDVPCSGVGTWRRSPDQRWRMDGAVLEGYTARQDEILAAASPLVKAGGRLIYMTCSLLPCENEERVDAFLSSETGNSFKRLNVLDLFEGAGLSPFADNWALNDTDLCLSPHSHGSDGFFVAVLERLDA